jgi:glucose/mannose-6-phosphate isomerase
LTAESSSAQPLDRAAVAKVDPTDQIADVLSLPEQLRDAVFKVESAELPQVDSPGGLLVAGMGGSGIGGRLARGILGDQASRPILSAAGYSLPGWTTAETTVLCASYSGETEETLACFEAAGIIGSNRVVVTTGGTLAQAARAEGVPVIPVAGGLQPRAAVAT